MVGIISSFPHIGRRIFDHSISIKEYIPMTRFLVSSFKDEKEKSIDEIVSNNYKLKENDIIKIDTSLGSIRNIQNHGFRLSVA